jgi:acyl-CoA thioester hydrolase
MRIEIPQSKKLVYEMLIPMRWGDMDAMGHINNTVYFRYMETARIDWMRIIGCAPSALGEGPIIVNAFCNFYRELRYPGDVRVKMYVSDPARTRVVRRAFALVILGVAISFILADIG